MPVNVDPEADELYDERALRRSGDSVVVTLTPGILRNAGVSVGDEVRIATPFDGGVITIEPVDDGDEGESEAPADA
ncbi:hypothetical protein [Saliphagus sp. LR7]|uniref:hypothetical protein n=1 Tax=Saliphagus sp. LR7 TaxID=2282654 RepID=UPI000DF7E9E5|nr:hypothetical protein [Saliphagus sp. LR7]